MHPDPTQELIAPRCLRDLLLGHLEAGGVSAWPGCDGLILEAVLDGYPEAVAAGTVPDWQQLLRQHPELSEALHAWLAAKDRWQFAVRGPGTTQGHGAERRRALASGVNRSGAAGAPAARAGAAPPRRPAAAPAADAPAAPA
jgi:hypothetical protein